MSRTVEVNHKIWIQAPLATVQSQFADLYHHIEANVHPKLRFEVLAQEPTRACFRQEVKLARRVTHPNVARTFDIGDHGPERFLTMEFVEGEPLSAAVEREGALASHRPLPVSHSPTSTRSAPTAGSSAASLVARTLPSTSPAPLSRRPSRLIASTWSRARS